MNRVVRQLLALSFTLTVSLGWVAVTTAETIGLSEFREAMHSPNEKTRLEAMVALAKQAEEVSREHGRGQTGLTAARELLEPVRDQIIAAARDRSAGVRGLSAHLMMWVRPGSDVTDALLALMDDDTNDVQAAAMGAIAIVGVGSTKARERMISELDPSQPRKFSWSARVVGEWKAGEAIPALIAGLQSDNYTVRLAAAKALGELGRKARRALGELKGVLSVVSQEEQRQQQLRLALEHSIKQVQEDNAQPSK